MTGKQASLSPLYFSFFLFLEKEKISASNSPICFNIHFTAPVMVMVSNPVLL